jgi:hypothetical protein
MTRPMYPEVARSNGVNARSGHEHSAWPHRRRDVQTLPCCGVSSQASQGSKSALDDREHPRDLLGVPAVAACRGPHAASLKLLAMAAPPSYVRTDKNKASTKVLFRTRSASAELVASRTSNPAVRRRVAKAERSTRFSSTTKTTGVARTKKAGAAASDD